MNRAMIGRTTTALLVVLFGCGRTPLSEETDSVALEAGGFAGSLPATGGDSGTGSTVANVGGIGATAGEAGTGGQRATRKVARWVATGAAHTCVVLNDGSVECWGMNDMGELGDGTLADHYSPVKVEGISNAWMVTTGYNHTCAILLTGAVQCWGSNHEGQLGNGTNMNSAVPVTVSGLPPSVTDIDNGGVPGHSCALGSDSKVYCWGNAYLDPNDPNNPQLASPAAITELRYSSAMAVSVGAEHSCALLTPGTVACWGRDSFGQLGSAATGDASMPIPIIDLGSAVSIAAGGYSTCTITAQSQVQCWGRNTDGQLGNAALTATGAQLSPTPVTVDLVTSASNIAVGSLHACALITDGSIRCWGSNSGGELGDGSVTPTGKPAVTVSGISNATHVAAGMHHTCAIVEDGRVKCWGSNLLGQLGIGNTIDTSLPVTVNGY